MLILFLIQICDITPEKDVQTLCLFYFASLCHNQKPSSHKTKKSHEGRII